MHVRDLTTLCICGSAVSRTFELTVDLHARGAVVEEAGIVVVTIPVYAVELRFWQIFLLCVVGR